MSQPLSPVDVHVGTRLRKLRADRGVSQFALARQLDIPLAQLEKQEHGLERIGAAQLQAICQYFAVPPKYFFGGSDTDTPS